MGPPRDDVAPEASGGGDRRWRWVVFGTCTSLYVCSLFFRAANAVVAPHLERDLGLASGALGSLTAAFFYAFAATQIPLLLFLDRAGARACMVALNLVGAGGAVLFATAETGAGAVAGEVLLGVGMAGNLVGSLKLFGGWFPRQEFATVGGAFTAIGTLGNIAATTPLALLVAAIGWRRAFLVASATTAALALVFLALAREPAAGEAPRTADDGGPIALGARLRRLVGSRDFWIISFGAFCRYGAFAAVQALWAGPYLVEIVGLSPVAAANVILLLNLAYVVGAPLGGWLSNRLLTSRKRVVLLALAGTAAAQAALALSTSAPRAWVVAAVLAALGVLSAFGQVVWAHVREVMPSRMAGTAMPGVNFFNMLGAAAFLHGTGWLLERGSLGAGARTAEAYRAAFATSACVTVVALALYAFTRDARVERPRQSSP